MPHVLRSFSRAWSQPSLLQHPPKSSPKLETGQPWRSQPHDGRRVGRRVLPHAVRLRAGSRRSGAGGSRSAVGTRGELTQPF
eukprot:8376670-Alexandrium_andersonii.AAC.1